MRIAKKRTIFLAGVLIGIGFLITSTKAQEVAIPVAKYSFGENQVIDETGNSQLFLRMGAQLTTDPVRGNVLQFSASQKSYAVFNKPLLNSRDCTISLFFYWESTGAGNWHQLFESHNLKTNSNFFFTPQNGWGGNQCSVISDAKEYSTYQAISGDPLSKNVWMHLAITIDDKNVSLYINGVRSSKNYMMFTPNVIDGDSLFLGGNPYRSNNFYISARLDEIQIFDQALATNQIQALANEVPLPEPINNSTVWAPSGNPVALTLDLADKRQTIQNFGSSDGWNTQRIGKYWPLEKKQKLAQLLFSAEKDAEGNPLGIGLSAWRFNIGAGTAEQGDASRISSESRRTEGFLNADGTTYNWNKQIGQQWFLNEAVKTHHIHHIIGWQNSPPVLYTNNHLGFRDYGTPTSTILKSQYFDDFARFLADVTTHFEGEGIHFDYISPLNEPQWAWAATTSGGTVSQEGTPWTNQEIHDVVVAINNEFTNRSISTKIFIGEAGSITHLFSGTGHASNQLPKFWNSFSSYSLVGKPAFANIASYHSYFTDYGSNLVSQRKSAFSKTLTLNPVPELWQTEYSLLGDGYRSGYPASYKLTEMECALALAKVIITDLNVANVTAWQWWSTFEGGKHGGEARFAIIEAATTNDNTDGAYHTNKLFYSIGNFSHFIRPGFKRIGVVRSDNMTVENEVNNVMFSAYSDETESKLILVAVNQTDAAKQFSLNVKNASNRVIKNPILYLTDEFNNLRKQNMDLSAESLVIPAHSVVTIAADLGYNTRLPVTESVNPYLAVSYNAPIHEIMVSLQPEASFQNISLYNTTGQLIEIVRLNPGQQKAVFKTSHLAGGIYLVTAAGPYSLESGKVVVPKK